jgi:16S rRNA (cytosine967-C5)-methyltransferase
LKLYKNLIPPIIKALQEIFIEGQQANYVVERTLKSNRKWGSRDRRFIAGQIYEVVRWYRLYYEAALQAKPQSEEDWWAVLVAAWLDQQLPLPDWEEVQRINSPEVLGRLEAAQKQRVLRESIPDWLDQRGLMELGEEQWTATLAALNQPAKLVLRVNTLKTRRKKLLTAFKKAGIEAEALGDHEAIVLHKNRKLTHLKEYKEGHFEVQDYSSQQVARLLRPHAGSWVVDACAGAGGKSLQMAALMHNKGTIKSMDVEAYKLKELKKRADRAGVNIIQTELMPKNQVFSRAEYLSTDYLLMDVPCSGSGVLRRNPDAKWKLSNDFIEEIRQTQRMIISEYSKLCKPDAKMVYATCSVFPSENQEQVAWFLEETEIGQDFELEESHAIFPQDQGFDGFFMALLRRKKASI